MRFAAVLLLTGTAFASLAKPVRYDPPEETAVFRPGAGVELAEANCLGCHSADYVEMQPRGAGFGRDFWRAEVVKMVNVHHAPIEPADVDTIVDYLTAAYAE